MVFLRFRSNEYGTSVSEHCCDDCGGVFTLCPAKGGADGDAEWGGCCLAETCGSYDIGRDIDLLWDHTLIGGE